MAGAFTGETGNAAAAGPAAADVALGSGIDGSRLLAAREEFGLAVEAGLDPSETVGGVLPEAFFPIGSVEAEWVEIATFEVV